MLPGQETCASQGSQRTCSPAGPAAAPLARRHTGARCHHRGAKPMRWVKLHPGTEDRAKMRCSMGVSSGLFFYNCVLFRNEFHCWNALPPPVPGRDPIRRDALCHWHFPCAPGPTGPARVPQRPGQASLRPARSTGTCQAPGLHARSRFGVGLTPLGPDAPRRAHPPRCPVPLVLPVYSASCWDRACVVAARTCVFRARAVEHALRRGLPAASLGAGSRATRFGVTGPPFHTCLSIRSQGRVYSGTTVSHTFPHLQQYIFASIIFKREKSTLAASTRWSAELRTSGHGVL